MAIRIQLRRDTAANWVSSNPVLRQGEIGIETDTLQMKLGNGTSTWTQISAYMNLVPDGNLTIGDYVMVNDIGVANGVVGLNNDKNAVIPASSIILEGATDNSFETTLTVVDPTADRTITFKNADGTVAFVADIPTTTDALTEGSTNKYFSDERAQDAVATSLAAGTHTNITVTYNDSANSLSLAAAPGYVDEQAVDAVAAALAAGTHTNISVSYNDAGNAISLTGAQTYNDENAQDAIGNNLGTGLSYNDTTGAISVNTSIIQARVANVTDTEIGYLDGVTSAIQTQINTKASSASPTFTGTATLAGTGDFLINGDANIRIAPASGSNAYIGTVSSDNIIATAAGLNLKAPIASPTFTGTVTIPSGASISGFAPLASPTFTGTVTLPGAPTSALHAATKSYVDGIAQGLDVKASVMYATTAQLATDYTNGNTLTAQTQELFMVDGQSPQVGDRVLVKNQSNEAENGIYQMTVLGVNPNRGAGGVAAVLVRTADAIPGDTLTKGSFTFVEYGNSLSGKGFVANVISGQGIQVTWSQFSEAGQVIAGVGLDITGNTLDIDSTVATLTGTQTLTNKTLTSPVINTPTGITKSDVGLANVDNTTDANKPVSTATQTALNLKLASATAASTYAPIASPTFTGTVSGITKTMVGLGSVDNTTDANKPVSTATQTALDLKLASATAATTYAPIANPTFTGTTTLGGTGDFLLNGTSNIRITPAAGSNVYIGTAAADNIITTAGNTQTLTNKSLTSPALTGTPTAPLAATGTNTTQIATTSFVQQELNILTTGAPAALNTLDELAAALGDDANYAATITTALGNKAPIASPTFTGTVSAPTITASNAFSLSNGQQTTFSVDASGNITAGGAVNGTTIPNTKTLVVTTDKLNVLAATSSSELAGIISDETGTGALVFANTPTLVTPNIGAATGTSLVLSGDLTVNGTTTTLNSTTISVDDKNIELGSVATPTDITADGGGITLKGTTNKTFNWVDATDAWTSSEHINLASGKSLYLNGTLLKDATETLTNKTLTSPVITGTSTISGSGDFLISGDTNIRLVPASGSNAYVGSLSANNIITTAANTQTLTNKTLSSSILSGTLTAGGSVGTAGQLLSSTSTGVEWIAAPTGYSAPTIGSTSIASGATVTTISGLTIGATSTTTVSGNTATTLDTNALSGFTTAEYVVSLKQGSKIRSSRVIVQTDGTSVDMTEYGITETGGTMTGIVVSAAVSSTNAVLQATVTDASVTNVTAKIVKVVV